ncbi:MAG TPA: Fic family protein [archaeon]|nr:Fic family protein [archaeon]
MVHISEKTINGKKYRYLVSSVRLPDGSIKKMSKIVKSKPRNTKNYSGYFLQKEKELNKNWALKKFGTNKILGEEEIGKIESIRIDYKHIIKKLGKEQTKDLFDRFIVNFTYESNALEGNSLTLKDVAIVIFDKRYSKDSDLREIYETRNSRSVLDLLLRKKFRISHESIIRMHKMLMKDIDTRSGYKKIPNFLLGKRLQTTPPEKVYFEMTKLIEWYEENIEKMHPILVASIFHSKFEKIHPFEDGNGRVGRFLVNAILVNNGYPPLIVRRTSRTAYFTCLEAADNNHYDKIERFLIEKFKNTYKNFFEVYVKYI